MSAPKHTPGPWRVDERTFGSMESRTVRDEKGREVTNLPPTPTGMEHRRVKADAALIAAAPELLAALRGTVARLEELTEDDRPVELLEARALLARVDGGGQ